MKVKVKTDKNALEENYYKALLLAGQLRVRLSLYAKEFYEELFTSTLPVGNNDWTFSAINKSRSYYIGDSAGVKIADGFTAGLHITEKELEQIKDGSDYGVWVPLSLGESREGVDVFDALRIQRYCKARKLNFAGVVMNFGCDNDFIPSSHLLSHMVESIHTVLGEVGISIGGGLFLGYEKLPEGISEIRVGEFILTGNSTYTGQKEESSLKGEQVFTVEYPVLAEFKDRLLINAGTKTLTADSFFDGFTIQSVNTEYTVLKKNKPHSYNAGVVTCRPSYKTLTLLL